MINAIIIENESESASALTNMVGKYCPEVNIVSCCDTLDCAIETINNHKPNLVFLDIELNGQNGLDLFRVFSDPGFEVIFVTAFDKYTIQAIRCSCLDYLLKPLNHEELVLAVGRFNKRNLQTAYKQQLENLVYTITCPAIEARIAIQTTEGVTFIKKSEIMLCEAEGNYCIITTCKGEKIVCSKSIGFIEDLLTEMKFYRCHKSFLVNFDYVKKLDKRDGLKLIMDNGAVAMVSIRKKDDLLLRLGVGQNEG